MHQLTTDNDDSRAWLLAAQALMDELHRRRAHTQAQIETSRRLVKQAQARLSRAKHWMELVHRKNGGGDDAV